MALPWQKCLYIKQPYPDNHVDASFLSNLRKNANVKTYKYKELVLLSGDVTQQYSATVIFIAIFSLISNHVYHNELSLMLIYIDFLLSVIGFFIWELNNGKAAKSSRYVLKEMSIFFSIMLTFSPVLKTLTQDTSDDSIWAMTSFFFVVHLLTFDYKASTTLKLSGSVSTNAAIFASVILASRLQTNLDVFGFMTFAIQWFGLFPSFRRFLTAKYPRSQKLFSILLIDFSIILLSHVSQTFTFFHIFTIIFLTFLCPKWLMWLQKYKNEIHGPWDEARLILSN